MAALADLILSLWAQLFLGWVPERPRWLRVLVQSLYALVALALLVVATISLFLLIDSLV